MDRPDEATLPGQAATREQSSAGAAPADGLPAAPDSDAADSGATDSAATDSGATDSGAAESADSAGPAEAGSAERQPDAADQPTSDDRLSSGDQPSYGDQPSSDDQSTPGGSQRRRGTTAGAAASRARRIGGRPANRPAGQLVGSDSADPAGAPAEEVAVADPAVAATAPATSDADVTSTVARSTATQDGPAPANDAGDPVADTRERPVTIRKRPGKPADATAQQEKSSAASAGALPPPPIAWATPSAPARASRPAWIVAAVFAVAAVVFAVLVGIRAYDKFGDRPSPNAERDRVLAAAKACLIATNAYDYRHLDTFEKNGLACATGGFATIFKRTVDDVLKSQAPTVKQVQTLQVTAAGVSSVTHDNAWNLLVYGQQTVSNTTSDNNIDPFGATVQMKFVHGAWRISSLCSQTYNGTTSRCF